MSAAQQRWGPDVEVLAALGLGRSYGATSRIWVRTLPGILQSGLWQQLERLPPAPARALVTDVGNDILYGWSASQILAWVEEGAARLQRFTQDIVMTDLPLESIRRLSRPKFLLFRSLLFPWCRLSFSQVLESAERITEGVFELAQRRGVGFFRLKPEWYGFDPIHFRLGCWRPAWQQILCGDEGGAPERFLISDALRLYLMRPERQWLAGRERVVPQAGLRLRQGARVWLY